MSSEETPLLQAAENGRDAVYDRFSRRKKMAIVGMVSGCGVMPLFITGTFAPCIPNIANDLNTTGALVNLAVSLSTFAFSIGGLVGASYSTHYGRRPVYLYSLPLLVVGSIGVALATDISSLLIWRFLQSLGAASGLVLGAGVIGDIYRVEERGRAMSVFIAACLLGPAMAPVVGGFAAYYYSWRSLQAFLGAFGLLEFILMYLLFPETSQPGARGIDKLAGREPAKFVVINPLRPLALLRSPNLLLISIVLSTSMVSYYLLMVPLAYTLGVRYHIPNEALLGACFIPSGVGNIFGASVIGRISDRTVIRWRRERGGVWYPEDRLRASLMAFGVLVPLSILIFGLINSFVDGPAGLFICLICLFVHGAGIEIAYGPCAAYLIDVMHSRSAESLAANDGLRSILMALAIAALLPMIDTFGILATHVFCASIIWGSFGLLWCIIRYGEQMRARVNVGFSTTENN